MTVEVDDMKVVEEDHLVPEPPELRVEHRCDHGACGAQAFVITEHDSRHLYWCSHHFGDMKEFVGLYVVVDHRDRINRKPGGSA